MSTQTLTLKRAAAEKREQASQKLKELKERLAKQLPGGTLAEGESRMTNEEISAARKEIEDLMTEAKEIEGLNSLDDLMNQPKDRMSAGAREVAATYGKGQDGTAVATKEPLLGKFGDYLRAIRSESGDYDAGKELSGDQKKALAFLRAQATKLTQGEPLTNVKALGDLDLKTLVGDDVGSAGRADYLVPPEYMTTLLRVMMEQQEFASRTRRVPMARRSVTFPRLVQTDPTDTRPMFSFAAVAKIAEAAQKPEREPSFDQLTLTAVKYAAYVEAGDELLEDSIIDLPPLLTDLLTQAISYEFDRDTIRGSGVGEPLGFLNSPALHSVNRAVANQISLMDVLNMEARFFGNGGIYLFNQSAIPQLYTLAQANLVAWNNDLTASVPGTLLGRAMVRSFKLPLLGTKGDFNLVDPSFYLTGEVQAITIQNSIHYRFRNDVTAWRAVYRAAGIPWPAGKFSMESNGTTPTYQVSPFVTLDVPAA